MLSEELSRVRIVVEGAGLLGANAGIERVFITYVELANQISPGNVTALVNSSAESVSSALPKDVRQIKVETPETGSLIWARRKLIKLATAISPDIWISPATPAPKLSGIPTISVIHDLTFKRYPSTMSFAARLFWSYSIRRAIKTSTCIITVSDCIRKEIQSEWPKCADKVYTVHNTIGTHLDGRCAEFPKAGRLSTLEEWREKNFDIVLTVGTVEPRKRPKDFVDVARKYEKEGRSDIGMVWIGHEGWKHHSFLRAFESCNQIIWVGGVSDSELKWFYKEADVFVSFSEYEGFGLPVLEAMTFDLPLALSRICSHEEVASTGTVFFEVGNLGSAAKAIQAAVARGPQDHSQNLRRFKRAHVLDQLREVIEKVHSS